MLTVPQRSSRMQRVIAARSFETTPAESPYRVPFATWIASSSAADPDDGDRGPNVSSARARSSAARDRAPAGTICAPLRSPPQEQMGAVADRARDACLDPRGRLLVDQGSHLGVRVEGIADTQRGGRSGDRARRARRRRASSARSASRPCSAGRCFASPLRPRARAASSRSASAKHDERVVPAELEHGPAVASAARDPLADRDPAREDDDLDRRVGEQHIEPISRGSPVTTASASEDTPRRAPRALSQSAASGVLSDGLSTIGAAAAIAGASLCATWFSGWLNGVIAATSRAPARGW